jgi:hypothetical protein
MEVNYYFFFETTLIDLSSFQLCLCLFVLEYNII